MLWLTLALASEGPLAEASVSGTFDTIEASMP